MPGPISALDATRIGATGVGSMPDREPREAARTVVGELPDLPHVVELPARGAGADAVGRSAALLIDLHVDLQPSGWRLVDRPGRDEHRAMSYLSEDLDAIEEAAQNYAGLLKVQVCGPWTLSAALQLPRGEPVLSDSGAVRDVADSLVETVAAHVADVRRRVPRADLVVQLDEPSLPLVLAGRIRSMSGLRVVEPVPEIEVELVLRRLAESAGSPLVVHCCAASPPIALFQRAGAAGVSLDLTLPPENWHDKTEQALGEAVESGVVVFAGLAASAGGQLPDAAATIAPLRRVWRRLGLDAALLATHVVVTPTCGLAGASPDQARDSLKRCGDVARLLVEDPEG